ncbi:pif-5 [Matsumuraeses phaseoli granulovirus]|uniref:Pif-5 n=1 Tax=Matsumuraeses phaseoli granulovirus TaxID=2760664 RepID=A0AAE7MLC4_9BBAC|nr:pif-5 [Matsumuraeses phaseoli granulovirus]QOD39979.1 pif-5 [Matsumuraeses phaseoli granulovirus]
MASFFSGLRRTNKVYPNSNNFITDHAQLIRNQAPGGFSLNNPLTMSLPNGDVVPGYNINGSFVTNANVNSVLRNNDVAGMRQIFPGATNTQMNGLTNLRRADNIPDSTMHTIQMRKNNIKQSHPETRVRDTAGVDRALNQNPRLRTYLQGAGAITLVGAGVYLVLRVGDLLGSIIDAINRTGGSWYYRGNNGGDNLNNIEACILRYRSCGMTHSLIEQFLCQLDPHDNTNVDPLLSYEEAISLCSGYNQQTEQSVCRASDTNADPTSLQYLDISQLDPNQTIQCVEPYDFGDLIGDLGLDWLLGDDGVITTSSNSFRSVSDNLLTIVMVVGGVLLLAFIGFFIYKMVIMKRYVQTEQ